MSVHTKLTTSMLRSWSHAASAALLLLAAAASGCRKGAEPREPVVATVGDASVAAPLVQAAGGAATEPQAAPDAAAGGKLHEMLAAHRRKGEPLVGGCDEACSDYKKAFDGYIRALLARDGGRRSIRFLETSLLVVDGERYGDRWVALYRDGKLAERRAQIEQVAAELAAWVEHVTDDAVERALATGVRYGEDDDPGYLVYFRHPPLPDDDTSVEWRFRIQERGWEWLVSEVDRHYRGE